MCIRLKGENFIPPLPDMPVQVIDSVVPAHMGGEQPLHKLAQLPSLAGLKSEVKMVGH